MISINRLSTKSDSIGIAASVLCFMHCIGTPFLLVAYSSASFGQKGHLWWWGSLDILFLTISFFAIYWSIANTSKIWIKYALWSSWIVLVLIILNEKIEIVAIPEAAIYFPTIALIYLHFYNRRYARSASK